MLRTDRKLSSPLNGRLFRSEASYSKDLFFTSISFQEHRTHIDVLDSALSNAQTNVLRLEEVKREMNKNLEQLQV